MVIFCRCDDGYHGDDCLPDVSMLSRVTERFNDISETIAAGWSIIGAGDGGEACGPMTSSTYLSFSKVCSFTSTTLRWSTFESIV